MTDAVTIPAERMIEIASSFHQPFTTGDLAHVDRIQSPTWVNRPRNPHEAPGREGWKATVQWIRSVFPDIVFTVEDAFVADDKVVLRTVARATWTGDFAARPGDGAPVAFTALEIHRFEGDQIAESWHLQDYYALMAQMRTVENVMGADLDPYPAWS